MIQQLAQSFQFGVAVTSSPECVGLFVVLDLNGCSCGNANLPSQKTYIRCIVRFRWRTSWVSIRRFTRCLLEGRGLQGYCFMSCCDINLSFGYGVLELKGSNILVYVCLLKIPSFSVFSLLKKVKRILKEINETSSVSSVK